MASGFALSAQYLRPGAIAVAFFGDGAMNQGMLLESMNLASAWKLPVLFVCKDDGWAITTQSARVTGGDLADRARSLGLPADEVDGGDVCSVWEATHLAIERARGGQGPGFLRARCVHLEAHFLGFPLLRAVRDPLREGPGTTVAMAGALLHPRGGSLNERLAGIRKVLDPVRATLNDARQDPGKDPVRRLRQSLGSDSGRLREMEDRAEEELRRVLDAALAERPS